MKTTSGSLIFTVPLNAKAHQLAEQFRRRQNDTGKGKQVYVNTLAVYAVDFYLRCLGIETDFLASDSCNFVMQTMMDVADLEVKNIGKLECRPVLPNEDFMYVPTDALSERIGYVAVQMTESLSEVSLLGFIETVPAEKIALTELRSLEDFPTYLYQLRHPQPVNLSHWLQDMFATGWQALEAFLEPQKQTELAINFRGTQGTKRGKLLDLEQEGEQVALCVGVKATSQPERDILVEIYPTGAQTYLPPDLQLSVLDAAGQSVMEAVARTTKNLQFEFSGEPGEQFSVKVVLGDVSVTEPFII